ncbi:dihydrolipoyl dehydrogenase [Calorimonas adulescens]|jgi:dihydrolipoamide dehydrogenase|uniref:Dihydrolipoyl dehydrogenase n=1 Tax=Calorimonas adulescens TaxID=2606906 RepID=A0A5D8Q8B3_9THEO|nr:dihydrolipoyl dehydrogenase [Calorimonas adulescens]TZE80712.1 dihydrolipoyl dehydrogenase [Calorimonas adulescens]
MTKRIVFIGAGPAGYVGAIKAAKMGAEAIVVENDRVGGTCLNRGCIPTKALLASSDVLTAIKESEEFGIHIDGKITPDFAAIMDRKDKIVERLVNGIEFLFEKNKVKMIKGIGKITDRNEVTVIKDDGSSEVLKADAIVVATGSSPAKIPIFPYDGKKVLFSDEVLNLRTLPSSMIIVGAGVIGCEFGMFFNNMGTEVTVVEMMDHALPLEDREIGREMERVFKRKKIKLMLSAKIVKVETTDNGVKALLESGEEIEAEMMLVAIGRKANIQDLGLEQVGVRTENGRIPVDEFMMTNVEGIYAVGDVVPGPQLAHLASAEAECAVENIMGKKCIMDYSAVPRGVFTDPEVAGVGLTEEEALSRGYTIKKGTFDFRGLGKAQAMGQLTGKVKVIADEKTGKILGASIIGPHATDLIQELVAGIKYGLTAAELGMAIHSHPTLSEAVMEALKDVNGDAIHKV